MGFLDLLFRHDFRYCSSSAKGIRFGKCAELLGYGCQSSLANGVAPIKFLIAYLAKYLELLVSKNCGEYQISVALEAPTTKRHIPRWRNAT